MTSYTMNRRRDNVCFLDLRRAKWPWPYDYSYKPSHFIEEQQCELPVLMKVTDGFYGTNSVNFTYSSEDIYLITHIMTQKRIIIQDEEGQLLSFPEDHSMLFYPVVDGRQEMTPEPLGKIIDKYAFSASRIQVKPESRKSISFCRGAGEQHSMVMDIFDWETTYDERYLVGNSVAYERMATTPTVIPIWMPISVTAATGFKDGSFEDYRKFMDQMKVATKNFDNSKTTGIKEIMLFEGKLSDYAEGTYDTIAPFDYGRIGQFRRASSLQNSEPNRPQIPPRQHSQSESNNKTQTRRDPPRTPTSGNGILSFLNPRKKKASFPDNQYERRDSTKKEEHPAYYTALHLNQDDKEETENVYMDEPVVDGNSGRPLPEIPASQQTQRRSLSRGGNTSSNCRNSKVRIPYEHVETNTPRLPSSTEPRQPSMTRPVPPPPQQDSGPMYGSYCELPESFEGKSVSEVSACLVELKFSHHVDKFKEADVDGTLLNALTKEMLVEDFNFTEFEVLKLMKYKRGWRPKKQ